jgi:hypothetical protein
VKLVAAMSLVLLGACPAPGGGGPVSGAECFVDEECITGEVCARDDVCWPAADVRPVRTTWTVRGQPASETTCAGFPDLHIVFDGSVRDTLGFSPVPCAIGQFFIDKLPRPFTRVELGVDDTRMWATTTIGPTGMAALDLTF